MTPHRLDLVSLVAGSVFLITGMAHLLGIDLITSWGAVVRAWPLLLVAAGVAVLVGILRTTRDA